MDIAEGYEERNSRANLIADRGFRREVEAVHRLGPRITGELLAELVHRHGPGVRSTMTMFAALDPDVLEALDAVLWPPMPLHVVQAAA
jgi:hypothetical protein